MSKHVPQNSSFSFSSASPDALSADTSPERDKAGSSNASVRELAANSPISWKGSSNDDDDFAAEQGALAVMTLSTREIRGRSNRQQVSECSQALSEDAAKVVKTAKVNYHRHQSSQTSSNNSDVPPLPVGYSNNLTNFTDQRLPYPTFSRRITVDENQLASLRNATRSPLTSRNEFNTTPTLLPNENSFDYGQLSLGAPSPNQKLKAMWSSMGVGDIGVGVKQRAQSDHQLNNAVLRDLIKERQQQSQRATTVKERCRSGFNYLNSYAGILKKLPAKKDSTVDESKQEEESSQSDIEERPQPAPQDRLMLEAEVCLSGNEVSFQNALNDQSPLSSGTPVKLLLEKCERQQEVEDEEAEEEEDDDDDLFERADEEAKVGGGVIRLMKTKTEVSQRSSSLDECIENISGYFEKRKEEFRKNEFTRDQRREAFQHAMTVTVLDPQGRKVEEASNQKQRKESMQIDEKFLKELYKKVDDLASSLQNAETDDSAGSVKVRKNRVASGNEKSLAEEIKKDPALLQLHPCTEPNSQDEANVNFSGSDDQE